MINNNFSGNRGIDIDGTTIGVGYVGTLCSRVYSTSVSQDGGAPLDAVIVTATHELGHNFNMDHDDG